MYSRKSGTFALLYAKINVKSNHFLFLTSLESPLNKGGSEGVWKYRWLRTFDETRDSALECAKQNIEASSLAEREKHVAKESVDKAVHEIAKIFKKGMIESGRLIKQNER